VTRFDELREQVLAAMAELTDDERISLLAELLRLYWTFRPGFQAPGQGGQG